MHLVTHLTAVSRVFGYALMNSLFRSGSEIAAAVAFTVLSTTEELKVLQYGSGRMYDKLYTPPENGAWGTKA